MNEPQEAAQDVQDQVDATPAEPVEAVTMDAPPPDLTTDYGRAGGHVLTDYGWLPEAVARKRGLIA